MPQKWKNLLRPALVLLSTFPLFFVFQNCGRNPDLVAQSLSSRLSLPSTNGLCRRTTEQEGPGNTVHRLLSEQPRIGAFRASGRKVHLDSVESDPLLDQSRQSENSADLELKAGERLSVLVDRRCQNESAGRASLSSQISSDSSESLHLPSDGEWNMIWELKEPLNVADLSRLAEEDPCIVGINREMILTTNAVPTDPQYANQLHLNTLAAATAWDIFYHRQNGIRSPVLIGIIDTGMQLNHPDLQPNIWTNPGEVPGNGSDDDGNGRIDDINGWDFVSNVNMGPLAADEIHSTHVAGLAAARATFPGDTSTPAGVAGVMGQQVQIMALDVFQGDGASTATISNAIRYAAEKNAHVINMSLGAAAAPTPDIIEAIDFALSRGTFVVVAAGNDGCAMVHQGGTVQNTCTRGGRAIPNIGSPASIVREGMITVAALHEQTQNLCGFSNRNLTSAQGAQIGQAIQIGAPGCGAVLGTPFAGNPASTGLLATFSAPLSSYNRISGTSMASPVVAGAVGLIYGLYRARTGATPSPALVERILLEGSNPDSVAVGGKRLHLQTLANYMNTNFPPNSSGGNGGDNPPPCP